MNIHRWLWALPILLGTAMALADPCSYDVEANDQMQFNTRLLLVPLGCAEVELTLRNVGHQSAQVMGHNWVLARSADMAQIVSRGATGEFIKSSLTQNDPKILAITPTIGGGEAATVRFSTSGLQARENYVFFCSSPGHSATMKGKLVFGP
jgi:azurin